MQLYAWYSWPNVVLCFFGGFLIDRVFGIRYTHKQSLKNRQIRYAKYVCVCYSICSQNESDICIMLHCFLCRLGTVIFSLFVCVGQVGLFFKNICLNERIDRSSLLII